MENRKNHYAFSMAFQNGDKIKLQNGVTIREYFAARAPAKPANWFEPKMIPAPDLQMLMDVELFEKATHKWRIEYKKQAAIQWPWAWADAVLAAGEEDRSA